MQRVYIALVLAALCAAAAAVTQSPAPEYAFAAVDQQARPEAGTLEHEGLERTYLRYVPNNLPPDPVPLVLVLHGGGNNAQITMEGTHEGRWNALADSENFIVAYPEGRLDPGSETSHHWNDCRSDITNPDALSTNDDVGFIAKLIDALAADYRVNTNRVYATGPSNGGLMTYRLAVALRDRLAAAAALIANMPANSECPAPGDAMPLFILLGTEDPFMPFEGGPYGVTFGGGRGQALSAAETTNIWITVNAPDPEPAVTNLPDLATNDQSTVTVFSFTNGIAGSEVLYYRVNGGGHQVPGAWPGTSEEALGPKNNDIVAVDEIWRFFSRHSR
ncbi:MAG: hypothetical protein JW951_03410 [Lentisphaerae bacterium]|nr:hypothetical protein [Lentisphaerota bacterium]